MADERIKPEWWTRKRMVESLGISDSTFTKWNVKPIAKIGRNTYYWFRDVLENRIRAKRRGSNCCEECGHGMNSIFSTRKDWIAFCPACNHPVDGTELFSMNYFEGK